MGIRQKQYTLTQLVQFWRDPDYIYISRTLDHMFSLSARPPRSTHGMDARKYWRYITILYVWHFTCGSAEKCKSLEFSLPINGRYCPVQGLLWRKLSFHEGKLACLERNSCTAFNYNHKAEDCKHFTAPCIKAISNPVMSFAMLIPRKEAEQCYKWRPINLRAWDRAVLLHYPGEYVLRMLKNGKYFAGFYGQEHGECYANDGTQYFINIYGYPCESLWINEGCTVYAQKYTLGDKIPPRAVIVGPWSNGLTVVVADVGDAPGYYVKGAVQAVGPFVRSTDFAILVVL